MKKINSSLAMFTAIASVCFALGANAKKIQAVQVTRCYRLCDLMNSSPSGSYRPYDGMQSCENVRIIVDQWPFEFKWLGSYYPAWPIDTGCSPQQLNYCCIVFELDPAAPAHVPAYVIDGLYGKFKVHEVRCRKE